VPKCDVILSLHTESTLNRFLTDHEQVDENLPKRHFCWVGSAQCSWEPEEAVASHTEGHLEEYLTRLGGREFVLRTVTPASTPK
jgi:hypothetical protein